MKEEFNFIYRRVIIKKIYKQKFSGIYDIEIMEYKGGEKQNQRL